MYMILSEMQISVLPIVLIVCTLFPLSGTRWSSHGPAPLCKPWAQTNQLVTKLTSQITGAAQCNYQNQIEKAQTIHIHIAFVQISSKKNYKNKCSKHMFFQPKINLFCSFFPKCQTMMKIQVMLRRHWPHKSRSFITSAPSPWNCKLLCELLINAYIYIYCCRCCFRSGLICSISGRATLGALCIFQKLFLPIPASQVPSEFYQLPLRVFINGWSLMTRPSCSKW